MDFFTGFAWPVPRAFAAAVAACRFEQGDVLYDGPMAYTAEERSWGDVVAELAHSIQVLDPPRSARSLPSEAGGRRFEANWESPVTFERVDYRADRTSILESTQGRLFTCLWRGDPSVLALPGDAEEPERPATGRELHASLEELVPTLRRDPAVASDGLLFAFVVDESSEASRSRQRAIVSALEGRFGSRTSTFAPDDVLQGGPAFHPALSICACGLPTRDESAVRGLLKPLLYTPTRGKEPAAADESPATDRFRLERHGVLAADAAVSDP